VSELARLAERDLASLRRAVVLAASVGSLDELEQVLRVCENYP
jgi:hypothetical protein